MDTREKALQFVRDKNFPFWKIYRGESRLSQCEITENETSSPEQAMELFEQEMTFDRPDGWYTVKVYPKSKGDKAANSFSFKVENQQQSNQSTSKLIPSGMDHQLFVQFIQDQLLQKQANERIEKKLDVILEAIMLMSDDDKDNDSDIKGLIKPLLMTWVGGLKPATAASAAAAPVLKSTTAFRS